MTDHMASPTALNDAAIRTGFYAFALWTGLLGLAAFFPDVQETFFSKPAASWDDMHRCFLALSGVYGIQVSLWTVSVARVAPKPEFCLTLGGLQMLGLLGLSFLQIRYAFLSILGLLRLLMDFIIAGYFLLLWSVTTPTDQQRKAA